MSSKLLKEEKYQNKDLEKNLSEVLIQISEIERKVEITRQILAETKDFDPCQLFWRLDRRSQNQISKIDLNIFLLENDVSVSKTQLNLLFSVLDINGDTVIDWNEFLKSTISVQKEVYDEGKAKGKLSAEVEQNAVRVFKEELEGISKLMSFVRKLVKCEGFELKKCFGILDNQGKGYFTSREVHEFVASVHGKSTSKRAERVIRRLDRNNDKKIELWEFEKLFEMYESIRIKRRDDDPLSNLVSPVSQISRKKSSSWIIASAEKEKETEKQKKNSMVYSPGEEGKMGIRRNTVAVLGREKENKGGEEGMENPEKIGIYGYDNSGGKSQGGERSSVKTVATTENISAVRISSPSKTKANANGVDTIKSPNKIGNRPLQNIGENKQDHEYLRRKRQKNTPEKQFKRKNSSSKPPRSPNMKNQTSNETYTRMLLGALETGKRKADDFYPQRQSNGFLEQTSQRRLKNRYNEIEEYKNRMRSRSKQLEEEKRNYEKYVREAKSNREALSKQKEDQRRREAYEASRRFVQESHTEINTYHHVSPYEKFCSKRNSRVDIRNSTDLIPKIGYSKENEMISPIPKVNEDFTITQIEHSIRINSATKNKPSHSYINEAEKKELIQSITSIIENYRLLEEQKKVLALRRDFIPSEAFNIFNNFEANYLSKEDLKILLESLKVSKNFQDVNNLIKSFDIDKDGVLSYDEFQAMILPESKKYRAKIAKKEAYDIESFEDYSIKTRKAIRDVMGCLVDTENFICFESEMIKDHLGKLVLDITHNSRNRNVDVDDVGDVLAECGLDVTYRELRAVLGRFGF